MLVVLVRRHVGGAHGEEIGALQRGDAGRLGELEVVADERGEAARGRVVHGRALAGGEDLRVVLPEVDLAVGGRRAFTGRTCTALL